MVMPLAVRQRARRNRSVGADPVDPTGQGRAWVWTAPGEGHFVDAPSNVIPSYMPLAPMPGGPPVSLVARNCWDAPRLIGNKLDALCAANGYSGKYLAQTQTIPANDSAVFRFTAPGAFCPKRMLIFPSIENEDSFVSSIKAGLEEQIITGGLSTGGIPLVTAELFDIQNACCPVLCMPCICAPGVPYEVTYANGEAAPQDVTIVLIGEYLDIPPDEYKNNLPPLGDCCPPPAMTKLLPFGLTIGAGNTGTITLTSPGQFCPSQLFIASSNAEFLQILSIQAGLDETIIAGPLPATMFTFNNKCCILECFKCLCAPGYPLKLTIRNTAIEGGGLPIFGVFTGCYVDACPPGM